VRTALRFGPSAHPATRTFNDVIPVIHHVLYCANHRSYKRSNRYNVKDSTNCHKYPAGDHYGDRSLGCNRLLSRYHSSYIHGGAKYYPLVLRGHSSWISLLSGLCHTNNRSLRVNVIVIKQHHSRVLPFLAFKHHSTSTYRVHYHHACTKHHLFQRKAHVHV